MLKVRYLFPLLLLASAILSLALPGCKPREEELQTSGNLEFSADTVKFDTVFTTLTTITKRLWVHNRNNKGVNVSLVSLEKPVGSSYTLVINGDLKQTANDLFIRGQDSLLILVRAKLPDNGQNTAAKDYVLEEKLNFVTNGNQQHVLLRSFGQNIYLHEGTYLPCGAVWRNDRPHVLYGTVGVRQNCTLTIRPGTRVYAHAGGALLVQGTLRVNEPTDFAPTDTVSATNRNIVRFTGDRQEAQYATAPGQWTGIVFDATSHNNLLRYALVQNASIGVLLYNPDNLVSQPDVTIQNSVIRYISSSSSFAGALSSLGKSAGVLSIAGTATITNTLFSDCYEYALLGIGGNYNLNFCTIGNFPATTAVRKTQSLTVTDAYAVNNKPVSYLPTLSVTNSIVWGSTDDELYFDNYDKYKAQVTVRNSLLKTQLYGAATDAPDKPGLAAPALTNIVNQDPQFLRTTKNYYRLNATSPAYKRANPVGTVPGFDLLNLPRATATPSLGAYESTK